MGSPVNSNPWGPSPIDQSRDCSQGLCNVYCLQWCYFISPPPPPPPLPSFFLESSSDVSPIFIIIMGSLASAFILVSCYACISEICRRRRNGFSTFDEHRIAAWLRTNEAQIGNRLDISLIKSIRVYKYRKDDGIVEYSDCSVCLSEFEENESLRLLPNCKHAFHIPCIDAWFKSHSNCPLCRASIAGTVTTTVEAVTVSTNQPIPGNQIATESGNIGGGIAGMNTNLSDEHHQNGDSVVVILDIETNSRNDTVSNVNGEDKVNRRSECQNSGDVVLMVDTLRVREMEEEESLGVRTSRRLEEREGEKTRPPSWEKISIK